jgi:hypothetical protein
MEEAYAWWASGVPGLRSAARRMRVQIGNPSMTEGLKIPDFLLRTKQQGTEPMTHTLTPAAAEAAKKVRKTHVPAYEFTLRISIPLDRAKLTDSITAAEAAVGKIQDALPVGATVETLLSNPLGKMEAKS